MNYKVVSIPRFEKQAKRLSKKFPSLKRDLSDLIDSLEKSPMQGVNLGNDCYKIRVKIASKNKGKSSGGRVITNVHVVQTTVYLLTIYDKSDQPDISDKELAELTNMIG